MSSSLDLGKYASDYSGIFPKKKIYETKLSQVDSPIRLYEAEKKGEKVFLKVVDKNALKEEDNYDFLISQIEKEKEISKKCNCEYTIRLNKVFETDNNIIFEKEYCDNDLKENLIKNGELGRSMVGKNNLQFFLHGSQPHKFC